MPDSAPPRQAFGNAAGERRPSAALRNLLRLSSAADGNLQVLGILPRVSAPLAVGVAVTAVLGTALGIAFTVASGALVGAIPAAVASGAGSASSAAALRLLGVAAALYVTRQVVDPVSSVLARTLAQRVNRHLEMRVMSAVNTPPGIAHLEDPAVLDLIATAQEVGTAGHRPGEVVIALRNLLPFWLQSITYSLILARFQWWLGLGLFAVTYYVAGVRRRENVRSAQVLAEQGHVARRSRYLRDLATTPTAAKEVRVFGLLEWLTERFAQEWLAGMLPFWRERAAAERRLALGAILTAAAQGVTAFALGWSAVHGDVTLAALTVYLAAIPGVTNLGTGNADDDRMAYGGVAVPAVLRLEALLRHGRGDAARDGLAVPPPVSLKPAAPRSAITFEGVTFRYPGSPTDVLSGLDLIIPAGTSLAIVGANGAGKTTLVKLLCGLYQPVSGRITVDGTDLRDVDPRAWRRRVAAIFQDFVQYHLSARENVALGAPATPGSNGEPPADRRALGEAAGKAGALELIERLPHGWETILSRQYPGGTDLSGGQWQRVALARALYAVNDSSNGHATGANVLILDEPTANLDVRAEAALYDRFLDITAGLTTIVISHRFSTVRRADRICVIEDGRVAEAGTHEELLTAGGRYATMFRLQAERFDESANDGETERAQRV